MDILSATPVQTHTYTFDECVGVCVCVYSVLRGGLELSYELPFTLNDPHDGLDHL